MGRIIPYIMENEKCLKPPTRYSWLTVTHLFWTQKYSQPTRVTPRPRRRAGPRRNSGNSPRSRRASAAAWRVATAPRRPNSAGPGRHRFSEASKVQSLVKKIDVIYTAAAWVLYQNSLYKNLRGSIPRRAHIFSIFQLYRTHSTLRIWGTLE